MTGLNLHDIAGSALAFINPWRDLTFTRTQVEWQTGSREPVTTTSTVTVKGKLQPANGQSLSQLGFNLAEYEYYRLYLSMDATHLDRLKQLGSDTFTCEGKTYRLVEKLNWLQDGWRETYCYEDKAEEGSIPTETPSTEEEND